jgi:hypothetical protein
MRLERTQGGAAPDDVALKANMNAFSCALRMRFTMEP